MPTGWFWSKAGTTQMVTMRIVAGIATLTVSGLILFRFLDGFAVIVFVLFLIALVTVSALLVHGLALTRKIVKSETRYNGFFGRAHIIAHIVPVSYLIVQYFGHVTLLLNLVYLLPFLFFYYSGRRLWKMLFARFGTKLYQFFILGNTGMMTGLTVLCALGLVYPAGFGPVPFSWAVLGYFAVHFLLTGIAVMRIESDLQGEISSAIAEK